jgi:hypothetical protein
MPQVFDVRPFQLDHVRARTHGGETTVVNLALACFACNVYKAGHASGYDPVTDKLQPLFNPRTESWNRHFKWRGPYLHGKTAKGRTTIEVLRINLPERVEHRLLLIQASLFPTKDQN